MSYCDATSRVHSKRNPLFAGAAELVRDGRRESGLLLSTIREGWLIFGPEGAVHETSPG